jgi:hypothetical protein
MTDEQIRQQTLKILRLLIEELKIELQAQLLRAGKKEA